MNLAAIVDPHPADAPALITAGGAVTTYRELRRATAGLRGRLLASGLAPGDRVAIISGNDPAFVFAYLAILGAGMVAVPLNPASPPAELQRQVAQVDASAIIAGPGGAAPAAAAAGSRPVLTAGGDADAGEPGDGGGQAGVVPRRPDDLAVLLFTGGTLGAPRPAMLSHGNLLANLDQVQRHPGRAVQPDDRILGVLPLFHIFGLNVVLGGTLLVGAALLLLDRFDPAATLDLVERHQLTVLVGTPTLYAALAAVPVPAVQAPRLGRVRLASCGAAPLPIDVAVGWQHRFGLPLRQGYGLTEASPVVTNSVMDEPPRLASIGVPIPGVELLLVDDDGEEALAGDPGEIWVRGPNVFLGYWHDAEATAAALTPDGWLRTGDIAVVSDDGELSIVDRSKDLIIVSGFNVFPAEVEEALAQHPAVAEVAVIGRPDAYRGESVQAFVVLDEAAAGGPPSPGDLMAWCAGRLVRYKCPTDITVVPALPHGLGGKLLRRTLRQTPPA
jgi:long-chain acyl-CoA synthetase